MHKINQKLAVLMAIQNMDNWVGLHTLLNYLDTGLAERSVRRWLNELIAEGLVEKKGQKKGTRYKAITSIARIQTTPSLFSEKSHAALSFIQQPIYLRKPVTYQIDWLEAYQPNHTFYLTTVQRSLLKEHGTRADTKDLAGTYARYIYNRLLIDLSYNSSRLEGNTYSLLDTEKLIIEGVGADNKLDAEKVMILNHKDAIRYLIDNAAKITINPNTIYTLHYLLADGLLPTTQTGIVREHPVKIGGSTYIPLHNKELLEKTLQIICNKAVLIENPYEQSFFLLAHIAYLQAFEDVNKRTARLAANIPLIYNNLVPLSFNDIPKEDYISAMLAIYEQHDIHPLADLYCFSYLRTCQHYSVHQEAMGFNKIRIIYRETRRALLRHILTAPLIGDAINAYIEEQTKQLIPAIEQAAFIQTIYEDLNTLAPSRIAGLGITAEQLLAWQQLSSQKKS